MADQANQNEYVEWLLSHSMLEKVRARAGIYGGQGRLWRYPYAESRPRVASAIASVWLTTYPPAIVTRDGESVLKTLGDPELWDNLVQIGIQGVHTGPMKKSGGLTGREFTPTIDGNFDRIDLEIDPAFGTLDEFIAMSHAAATHNAVVIDDIVPAHTGKGADFRLAELHFRDFAGLYHMVEIREEDWGLLPDVPAGRDAANLNMAAVEALAQRDYIVGPLTRTIFYDPGIKDTDWSATSPVVGADGVTRRWVYLHYFKEGQPSLNWLDPSMAAQQLILGDALHSLDVLGARGLRLDANGFLGVEANAGGPTAGPAWSEGHPLSVVGNQLIAGMVRKLGAFTFQELNLAVDDIATMSKGGADLSYDFITRPAYHQALVSGDTEFLRLMLKTMNNYNIDPASLIHGLQNHDELTIELVHFWRLHASEIYLFEGAPITGLELRERIRAMMYERLTGPNAPYNLRFVENGVACTTASFIAAALGFSDLRNLTADQFELIRRVHLLLVMYNGFQPGVLALSGWDLVGALVLDPSQVAPMLAEGDTRWIERGAYDLINLNPGATVSAGGMPRANALYGPINDQLDQPNSFVSALKQLLEVRQRYRIYAATQLEVPDVTSKSLLVMVHELPGGLGTQITALNFGQTPIDEDVILSKVAPGLVINMLNENPEGILTATGHLQLRLDGYEGKSLRIDHSPTVAE